MNHIYTEEELKARKDSRFNRDEKALVLKNLKEYPNLAALIKRQNEFDFNRDQA